MFVDVEHYRFAGKLIDWSFVKSNAPKEDLETCDQSADEALEIARIILERKSLCEFRFKIASRKPDIQATLVVPKTWRMF